MVGGSAFHHAQRRGRRLAAIDLAKRATGRLCRLQQSPAEMEVPAMEREPPAAHTLGDEGIGGEMTQARQDRVLSAEERRDLRVQLR